MMLALRTIRHLKWQQIAAQARLRLASRFDGAALPAASPWPGLRMRPRMEFLPPAPPATSVDNILVGRYTFAGQTREAGFPPDWDIDAPKLWQYNLHYFETLWALPLEQGRALTEHWMAHHSPGRGRVGWEPYPTSLRLINWIGYFFGRHRDATLADEAFRDRLWASLHAQAEHLSRRLERHLMGNHLFENAVALALAGAAFEGAAARRWLQTGLSVLRREVPEQILDDGGHFERSPMYHSRILYGLLTLLNAGDADLDALCREPAARMARTLAAMRHPDGQIALLNDSAFDIYNPPGELLGYARQHLGNEAGGDEGIDSPEGSFALPRTGYYGARHGGTYVICDAGPVGPDYIPGHAHGDIFSFELSWNGLRFVVDSGCCEYVEGPMRGYCRSTAAHNTVEIGGADQCEFWGAFRVARRGRPRDVAWQPRDGGFALDAWHDGYRRLPGQPIHRRRFVWRDVGALAVRDRVSASRPVRSVGRIHLHPDCEAQRAGEREVRVTRGETQLRIVFSGAGKPALGKSWYCPRFGQRIGNTVIEVAAEGREIASAFCIAEADRAIELDVEGEATIDGRPVGW